VRVVGACPDAPLDFRAPSYRGPTVIVLGCERTGLTPAMRRACDALVHIPMVGRLDSLNLEKPLLASNTISSKSLRSRDALEGVRPLWSPHASASVGARSAHAEQRGES
jgi:hypothetical protein